MEEELFTGYYTVLFTVKIDVDEVNKESLIKQAIAQLIDNIQKEIADIEYFK